MPFSNTSRATCWTPLHYTKDLKNGNCGLSRQALCFNESLCTECGESVINLSPCGAHDFAILNCKFSFILRLLRCACNSLITILQSVLLVKHACYGRLSISYVVVFVGCFPKELYLPLVFICIFLCRALYHWCRVFSELKPGFP